MSKHIISIVLIVFISNCSRSQAFILPIPSDKDNSPQTLAGQGYDNQKNTVSDFEFYNSNYGIFGLDILQSRGGGFWPRGTGNQYIFAGGFWLGAKKLWNGELKKYVTVSYNPNNGRSWFVPGRIEDGDSMNTDASGDYMLNLSPEFDKYSGAPLGSSNSTYWPVWDTDDNEYLESGDYYGRYVYEKEKRNRNSYPKGPAFISGEDIFCVFKDTDLSYYDGGYSRRKSEGYPLGLQVEHTVYTWGTQDEKDMVFLRYDIINKSTDTLRECWFAPLYDADIAHVSNSQAGASNDRCRFFNADETLNLAVNWSNTDQKEAGLGFGYIGYMFIKTPAVKRCEKMVDAVVDGIAGEYCCQCTQRSIESGEDKCIDSIIFKKEEESFQRSDKDTYPEWDQLGLVTFRNWPIELDPRDDKDRYNFISKSVRDGDNGPGDKRILMSSGPFNLLPADTVSFWVGIVFALPAVNTEPDGSDEDLGLYYLQKTLGRKAFITKNSLIDKATRAKVFFESGMKTGIVDDENKRTDFKPGITIAPNPAYDMITVNFKYESTHVNAIEIFNMLGERVLIIDRPDIANNELNIGLKGLMPGAYMVRAFFGNEYCTSRFNLVK